MTLESVIVTVLAALVTGIIGWLRQSPLGQKIPEGWSGALLAAVANLHPDDYLKLYDSVKSTADRRTAAVKAASNYLQPDVAAEFVDYVSARLRRSSK